MTTLTNDAQTANRIVSDLDANLLVEAGAGTGKTYALVSRVIALIKSGKATMSGIVAITFTEAAAAELSERIRSRMEELQDPGYVAAGNDPLLPLSGDEPGRIARAINEIDQASIQTIHSFAAQILRDRPLAAGLPPGWATLDEIESRQLFNDAWDLWLDEALGQDGDAGLQDSLRHLLGISVGIDKWRELALSFSTDYDRLCNDNAMSDIDLRAISQDTLAKLQDLESGCSNASDNLYQQLAGAIETVQAVADVADNPIYAIRVLKEGAKVGPTGNVGSKRNWRIDPKPVREEFRSIGVNFQIAVNSAPMLPLLHSLRQRFAIKYSIDRKADGVATFEDLLVWARDVLRDDAETRAYLQQKYSHILIDEFQDTDPLQAEIAFYLAARSGADVSGRDWHSIPLHPGKLFIVGDAKQSIYRFRRADIGVTQLVKDSGQMESLTLSENRRSQEPVLDWVNAVFGRLMVQDGDGPPVQAEYIPLQANAGTQQPGLGTAQYFGGGAGDSADYIRRKQAQDVASLITASVAGNGGRNVYDKDTKCVRDARLGDVCILVRSRTGLGILERGLEAANIPYRIEGGSLLFNTQEVRDLLNCLRAIDNPQDAVSVAAALRSPAFACSDADLLQWRDAGGGWDYTSDRELEDPPRPVVDAMAILDQYHRRHQTESVAGLIAEFIRDRRLDELDLAEPRPREMWRRRQFLVAQARNQEYNADNGGAPLTLRRFIDWAENQQEENARITEIAAPETDDDSVRIMTMHAAKGLEFPIVILLGFNAPHRERNNNLLIGTSEARAEVSLAKDITTPGYSELAALENSHEIAEIVRLAYVAATRARDHLLISLHRGNRQSKSLAADITELSDSLPHSDARPGEVIPLPTPAPAEGVAPDAPYNSSEWQAQRDGEIAARSRPQAVTATGIAKSGVSAAAQSIDDKDAVGDADAGPRLGRGGRSGTAFGSALHAVLQQVVERMAPDLPLVAGAGVDEYLARWDDEIVQLANQQTADKGIASRNSSEIIRLARKALRTPAVAAALCAPGLWSEIPVAAPIATPIGDVVIEGIIDLLYQDADGDLVVIDYKSDDVNAEEIAARLERYQWQGAAYAVALESVTGKTVKDVQFLFVRLDDPLRQVANLRELMSQLPDNIPAAG